MCPSRKDLGLGAIIPYVCCTMAFVGEHIAMDVVLNNKSDKLIKEYRQRDSETAQ